MARKRALIVKFGAIGDVIMAIPAVHALYQQGFDIHWVCGQAVQPLLACYSWIHTILVDDKRILNGTWLERAKSIGSLWSRISFKKYSLCATLYYDRRYRVLTLLVRTPRRIALSHDSRETALLPGRHHTEEYARVLLSMEDGCREQSIRPVLPDRLPEFPWHPKKGFRRIALVPGGGNALIHELAAGRLPQQILRRWPVENYVAVARELVSRGWEVVLLGGPEDAWVDPHFEQLEVTDCIGKLSLPEVVSALNSCDAVITHDTGPLHLAGLSAACLIGIFGPVDPAMRIPRRPYAMAIWGGQDFACRPCYDGRDFAPCQFNGCMHQVTPSLVLRELDQLLAAQSRGEDRPWRIVSPITSMLIAPNGML
ncbi:MAG: glycosyltransferase family 9 protein [Acidobacteriota bacterium]|nr:glycosyltransferase family 9 protein [Acidobacteriota bacterium]